MLYLSLVLVFILSYSFYFYGKKRALSLKFKKNENLSSLPDYYGYYVVLLVFFPAIIIWFFLLLFKSNFQEMFVMSPVLFPDVATWSSGKFGLIMNKISNLSMIVNLSEIDLTVGDKSILKMASESEIIAAKNLANFDKIYGWSNLTLFIILPVLLGFLATKSISGKLNAQPIVEKIISYVIKGSSYIAIFITFGIFFSLVFEAINFFRYYRMQTSEHCNISI